MTGLNHAATGAFVAVLVHNPVIALPAALLSHFAIDALPHWDYKFKRPGMTQIVAMVDLTFTLSLLLVLSVTIDASARLVIACGFLGVLPDTMWLPEILQGKKPPINRKTLLHRLRRIHARIQWSESKHGAYVEIVWFILIIFLLYKV